MQTLTPKQLESRFSPKEKKTRATAINDADILAVFDAEASQVVVMPVKTEKDDSREGVISTNTVYTFLRRNSNLFYRWMLDSDGLTVIAFAAIQHEGFSAYEYKPKSE